MGDDVYLHWRAQANSGWNFKGLGSRLTANSNGYPGFLYTDEGRFIYIGLEKKL